MTPAAEQAATRPAVVVDADVHLHESPAALARHCDEPWRHALHALEGIPERYLDMPGLSPGESAGGYQARFPTSYEHRTVDTPEQMRRELDELGIDIGVLFPDHLLKLPVLTQPPYAAALARAYNSLLVREWAANETKLLGCLCACPQDPEDSAREIERYKDEPAVVGVYLPCAGVDPLWGHRRYDPIYEAAQHAGFPVLLHSVTVTHPAFPFNNHGFDTEIARHTISHTFSMISNLAHMVTTGVPVRYPELRIAATEAGISWVPFLMNRLDKEYLERRREVPFLTERPSHYLKQCYYATQPIEEPEDMGDLARLIDLYAGEDTTIFASDWPHHDFDHPMKVRQIPMSDEKMRKVLGLNALRLFGIDEEGNRV